MVTYDDLVAKLHELPPYDRHRAEWIMNKDHFRAMWVLATGEEPTEGQFHAALAAEKALLGLPVRIEDDATEISLRVPTRTDVVVPPEVTAW